MALTKVAGDILDPGLSIAGVVTATAFDGPFRGGSSSDIIAGIGTFTELDVNGNVDISGNLVVHGDQTTLNTTLRNVELLRVTANSSTTAGIITQTGSGDILNLFDGTTEVLTVTDGGNVGVGTVTPSTVMHLLASDTYLTMQSSSASGNAGILFKDSSGTQNGVIFYDFDNDYLKLSTNDDTEAFRITSSGKVGINTTTPQTELEVFSDTFSNITIHSARTSGNIGGFDFSNGASAAGIQTAQYFVHTSGHHYWHCNGSERLKLENDGDLTITGVDNAELKLKCGASTGNNILAFLNSAGATKGRIFYDSDNSFMVFNTDGTATERMRITNVGSVGITTSDPHGRLHIHGESGTDSIVMERAGSAGGDSKWGIKPYAKGLYFRSNSDNSNNFNSRDRFALLWDGTDARGSDVAFFGTVAGIASCKWDASANTLKFKDNSKLVLGDGDDLSIYWSGSRAKINSLNSNLDIESDYIALKNQANSKEYLNCTNGEAVKIYFNHAQKFATTDTGISVTGEVATSQDYPNYRPTFDFNLAGVKKLDPRITYSRTGPASYIDEYGIVRLSAYNTPRFDHYPLTRESRGLLIEPARTNQMIYSSDITGDGVQNGTVTGDATTAPDGTTTADKYAANSTNGIHRIDMPFTSGQISNSTAYTFSVFVKANGYDKLHIRYGGYNADNHGLGYDLSDGTTFAGKYDGTSALGGVTSSSMVAYPNGWYRCSFTFTTASDSASGVAQMFYYISNSESTTNFAGDGSSGMYFWGAQMEVGGFVTSYIPTDGETRTRGGDIAYLDGTVGTEFDDIYRSDEGTFIIDWFNNPDGNHNDGYVFTVDDGTGNNRIAAVNSNNYQVTVTSGGSSQGTRDLGSINSGANKIAFTYKHNDQATSLNGSDASVDTSSALPTGVKYMWFGLRQGQYDFLGGYISRIVYYTKRLPNNQLKTLSS